MRVEIPARPIVTGPPPGPGRVLDKAAYAALCGFLFAIPWEGAPLLSGFTFGRVLGLAALVIALLRLATTWQRRQLSTLHYLMLSFAGFSALSLLWTADWDGTTTRIGTYIQLLIVVWLIWEVATTESRVRGLLRAYVLGISVISIVTIRNFFSGATAAKVNALNGIQKWEDTRFSVSGLNENDLGLMLAMSIPMMIYLAIKTRGQLGKLTLWIQVVACVSAILLTGSRGALISGGVASLMLPLTIGQLPRAQKLTAGIACAVVLACGAFVIPVDIWERLGQISTELTSGTLTHRTVIWTAGLGALRDNAFLGVGSGAYAATVLRVIDVPYVAHNTFLSVLVELGFAGALLLAGLLASLFFSTFRMRYVEKCLWLTVLLSWSTGVMALTWEYRKPTWVMFGLLAAHAYARRSEVAHAWNRVSSRSFRQPIRASFTPVYPYRVPGVS